MYQPEQKKKFMEQYTQSPSVLHSCLMVFKACQPFEEQWGADLCTQSGPELQKMIDSIVGLREYGRKTRLSILREYVKWCQETGVEGACDGIFHVSVEGVGKMQEQTVRSPLHLQTCLDAVFDPESEKTVDATCRLYYWLAFSGLREEDIIRVRASDVNFKTMEILLDGENYPIYREALMTFRVCATEKAFLYKHANYETVRDRADGNLLIRGIRSQPNVKYLRMVCSTKYGKAVEEGNTDIRLSYFRVWLSGVFYRFYEAESAGLEPDYTAVVERLMEGKSYSFESDRHTIRAYRMRRLRQLKQDYQNWKLTLAR